MPDRLTSPAGTLLLVDGSALAYRSFHAFLRAPLQTSKGENVSAIFGFANSLLHVLEDEQPTHAAVVIDSKEPTFRHLRYPQYKATREKMPEELVAQLGGIRSIVEALRIPLLQVPGVEADDVIGTLALRAAKAGLAVRILSADKDFMQLVDEQIQLCLPGKGGNDSERVDVQKVVTRFGVKPEQIIDLLALMGDASDNVPGVERVGEKTAAELICTFGTLEGIYARLSEVTKPALRRSLEQGKDSAFLSRELVTIKRDVPLPMGIEALQRVPPDFETLPQLFHRYEFRSLLERIPARPSVATPDTSRSYRLVRTDQELLELLQELRTRGFFVIDTETTGLDPMQAELVGISLSWAVGQAAYIPMRAPQGLFADRNDAVELHDSLEQLKQLLADPDVQKAGQNVKYDWHVLERCGFPLKGVCFDTMVAHYCIEPSATSHGLDALSLEYFGYTKIKTTELIGRGRQQITMDQVPVAKVAEYACEDADYTFRLVEKLRLQLQERDVQQLFLEVELPLIDVLRRMEAFGVALNAESLHEMRSRFEIRAAELEKEIHVHAGEPFNIHSPRQLAEILYEKLKIHEQLGIKRLPKTQSGFSTNAQVLEQMESHPLIARILEFRQIEKLRSTYVDALPRLVNPRTGKIHTSFNQSVAATGRLSSSDPNLQNIPIRTPLGREIRRAFRSSFPEGTLISADYSQVELRILAHLADDHHLKEAFRNNQDVHKSTASLIFKVNPEQVTPEMRTRAKAINFGIIYGMGAQRLARETGISVAEAQGFIQRYFEVFSGVKQYLDKTLEKARADGFVTTLLGRRRYIPELRSADRQLAATAQNVAVNTPIQGTAADLIKKAMLRVDREIDEQALRSRMVLQVHDELVFDVCPGESEAVRSIARRCMEGAMSMSVPLSVDIGEGPTWLAAH